MLLAVYAALAHVGAMAGGAFPGAENGTQVLTQMVPALFGPWGAVILAALFLIACLNTCVGLISCCSTYFHQLCPRISYRMWAAFFALVSMVISNAGLNQIIAVSVPVLGVLYPVAIVLIVLGLCHRWLGRFDRVYPAAIGVTGVFSVLFALADLGVPLPGLSALPLAGVGLGWLLPACIGVVAGLFFSSGQKG